jgi:hypothetical protein
VKEVLGPREGANESLGRSPLFEYITGILAPARSTADPLEAQAELVGEAESIEEASDDLEPPPIVPFAPTLDPQALPHSFGLTFVLEGAAPQISLCVTWGEYSSRGDRWYRRPYFMVVNSLDAGQNADVRPDDLGTSRLTNAQGHPVRIHVRSRGEAADRRRVSVFFLNERVPARSDRTGPEEHLFQPQVRIVAEPGTRIVADEMQTIDLSEDPDDATINLLFKTSTVMARGHMCAALWHDVDPQSPVQSDELERDRPVGPPFRWDDMETLPSESASRFSLPDARTEFVPLFSVPMPDLEWQGDERPELRAQELAESWDPERLRDSLEPLTRDYERWLERLAEDSLALASPAIQEAARRHINQARRLLGKLRDAIQILTDDEHVRLAFCFANRAMAKQFEWLGLTLEWRPFQLAFILSVIPSLADPSREDREDCDLLWVATAAGKTEAYLGAIAFLLGHRRIRATNGSGSREPTGGGTAVFSRYTLRLLTTQQFRRAVRLLTACDLLRVSRENNGIRGWRPSTCAIREDWIWGTLRFSIGLWVGESLTPNRMQDRQYFDGRQVVTIAGALSRLRGSPGEGEPAQILECPACASLLAVPDRGLPPGAYEVHLVHSSAERPSSTPTNAELSGTVRVNRAGIHPHPAAPGNRVFWTLSLQVSLDQAMSSEDIDAWWASNVGPSLQGSQLEAVRASRPGYFIRVFRSARGRRQETDFEVICANPECPLIHPWAEGVPFSETSTGGSPGAPEGDLELREVLPPFRDATDGRWADRVPIPAYTVDAQIYHRCPSVVVATVDKFARLPFEPRSASLFGNVDSYHMLYGFYREGAPPEDFQVTRPRSAIQHPRPDRMGSGRQAVNLWRHVPGFNPPELILQDELHLIDGPLGSLTGCFETAIDLLATRDGVSPKYIASTATIRRSGTQVDSVFRRNVTVFPAPGLDAGDNFFVRQIEEHALGAARAGRLYAGIAAPGKGAQTPVVRMWSLLLQEVFERRSAGAATDEQADPFWTLTGYFNAIRELAGARALYQQDIRERVNELVLTAPRPLEPPVELSSRTSSTDLPSILEDLNVSIPRAAHDVVLSTSMFGVGVDIPRLGLMVVHGQPKKTSDYIQATGRIGRTAPGLVVTFYRVTRPRDLSHYEYFTSYHSVLHRHVEPITVFPFAPGVRERILGPVLTALLRIGLTIQGQRFASEWRIDQGIAGGARVSGAPRMSDHRSDPEVRAGALALEDRASDQPATRRPQPDQVRHESNVALDRWQTTARRRGASLVYSEYAPRDIPVWDVVLGDSWHEWNGKDVVFRNAPQSLRDIEETLGIET